MTCNHKNNKQDNAVSGGDIEAVFKMKSLFEKAGLPKSAASLIDMMIAAEDVEVIDDNDSLFIRIKRNIDE